MKISKRLLHKADTYLCHSDVFLFKAIQHAIEHKNTVWPEDKLHHKYGHRACMLNAKRYKVIGTKLLRYSNSLK